MVQPFAFQPQPQVPGKSDQVIQFGGKFLPGLLALEGVQLEIDAAPMMFEQRAAPGQSDSEFLQPLVPDAAAPMVSAERRQDRIAKRELRFADVAANEIGVLIFKWFYAKMLPCKEQACATVHQQARRLGQWQEMGGAMVLASGQQIIRSEEHTSE